jgi:hypothetical protein
VFQTLFGGAGRLHFVTAGRKVQADDAAVLFLVFDDQNGGHWLKLHDKRAAESGKNDPLVLRRMTPKVQLAIAEIVGTDTDSNSRIPAG